MNGRITRASSLRRLASLSLIIGLWTNPLCWSIHARSSKPDNTAARSGDKAPARGADVTTSPSDTGTKREKLRETYGKLPLRFEANHGQTDREVKFFSRGNNYGLYLTSREAVMVLRNESGEKKVASAERPDERRADVASSDAVLKMKFAGANRRPKVTGLDELAGKSNYFIGKNPKLWRTNVSHFAKVKYEQVYPGIDVVYYGNQQQLEYDFVVSPSGNPNSIRLAYKGASEIRIDENGDLLLVTPGGEVRQHKPIVYQETDGQRRDISSHYVLSARNEVRFEVGNYDRRQPLIIDPVISYSTYLGGAFYDNMGDIVVDDSGHAYIVGKTQSPNFPTRNSLQPFNAGSTSTFHYDAFVTKLNPTGTDLVFSTFIGGTDYDAGSDIARDAGGNIYITGSTSSNNFPTAGNPYQANGGGRNVDLFVTKLNATGSALLYSTYLGGRADDFGNGIVLDSERNIYVTGDTASSNFPTANAFQSSYGGGGTDSFVTKFNAAGSDLLFSTFLGGSGNDGASFYGGGIAVDSSNSVYITGYTYSLNFPTVSPLQPNPGGGSGGSCSADCPDAYAAKFTPAGNALVYSTYLGGNDYDTGNDIVVDALGNAYVTGNAFSNNFPTTPGSLKPTKTDTFDRYFVSKINPLGTAFVYSTYIFRGGLGIALNENGDAYVVGQGAAVSKLNATGTALDWFVRFGGRNRFTETSPDNENCHGIALDSAGSAYVVGETFSPTFQVTPGAFQQFMDLSGSCGGSPCNSAYIVKIEDTVGYSINVRVADPGGNGMGGVLLNLTGSLKATGATDANGNYSFQNLKPGGSYTVVPVKTGVTFSPTSRSFSNITSDQPADFTGTAPAVRISGRVLNANSGGVSGVTVTLSGTQSGSVLTDSGGNYNFSSLPGGGTYTVTPSRGTDKFVPSTKTFSNVFSDQLTNFTLVYDISGRVTDGSGNGVAAVTVTLSGAQSATVQTNNNGDYLFTDLPAAGSYTVTPSKIDPILTYVFTPASQTVSTLSANSTINFSSSTIILSELKPLADAYVQDGTAANTNFGSANTLKVETDSKTNNAKNFDSFLRFPISGIAGNVTSVKLRIFAASSTTTGVQTAVYAVSSTTWSETAITWNNKPQRGTQLATATVNSTNFTSYDLDITAQVRLEKNAGNESISLALHNPTASTVFVTLNSREAAANRPQLIVTTSPLPNAAPSVALTSPASGAPPFISPANITVSANATDSDGTISKVEFYAGTTKIGTATAAPYQITWGPVSDGNYSLTAVATDNSSATTVSSPVAISVISPNSLPSITLDSPLSGTTFPAGSNVSLAATATDLDGTITKVEFFAGAALIGTATAPSAGATYNVTWTNVIPGAYALTARATDNLNGTQNSGVLNINVATQTGLSPTADAYVRDGSSATTNFGTVNELQTQVGSTGSNRESYIKFDITTITGIVNAKLRLYGRLSDTSGTNVPVAVHPVPPTEPDWTETGITWNTKPNTGAALTSTTVIDNNGRWYEWNITAFIQSEKNAGRNTIKLAIKNTAPSTPFATFNSKQNDNNRPQLILWTTQARNALLVTNSTTLGVGDNAVRTRLQNLGYTVTVKAAGTNNNAVQSTDANGKTVVLISSSVTTNNVLAKFRHVAVPVITWESELFDDHGFTGSAANDSGTATGQTRVAISNSAHPLAAGQSGSPTVSASSTFSWGRPNGNPVAVATLFDDATKFVIFGFDNMAAMTGTNMNAPARRVGFFFTDLTANGLTTEGNLLFDAAVKWATELITAPFIGSLTPSNGLAGTQVSISGVNFGSAQGTSTVAFNGVTAIPTSWSDTTIIVPVPLFATTGPVVITVNGVASSGLVFSVGATDSDGDGLPDSWEIQYFGNLNQTANGDPDGDGLTNLQEFQQGRNPTKSALADSGDFVNLKIYTPLSPLP
jgi:hypothetical protein